MAGRRQNANDLPSSEITATIYASMRAAPGLQRRAAVEAADWLRGVCEEERRRKFGSRPQK